jgi:hypothetical protein
LKISVILGLSPGKRGPRTKKERLSGELAGIRAEIAAAKKE